MESLERRQRHGRERLENLLAALQPADPKSGFRPQGAGKQPPPIYLQTKSWDCLGSGGQAGAPLWTEWV